MTFYRKIRYLLQINKKIDVNETITRYILSKSQFKISTKEVKYSAFMPPKKYPDEISVYRISTLSLKKIWQIGSEKVAKVQGKTLYGRGDALVKDVQEISHIVNSKLQKLLVLSDKKSHPLHANIININTDEAKRRELALKLASVFKFFAKE